MASSTGDPITVRVKLYSILRKMPEGGVGPPRNKIKLTLRAGSVVRDVLNCLQVPEIDIVFSLNNEVVDIDTRLQDGDFLSLIPAVGGGSLTVCEAV